MLGPRIKEHMMKLVSLNNVGVGYHSTSVLKKIDFDIHSGDYLGIIGPNGSGKTTLLRTILGLISPQVGERKVSANVRFGYVKQRQYLDPLFPFTVNEVVLMGRLPLQGLLGRVSVLDTDKVEEILNLMGLASLAGQAYRNLSEGQKQRVLIARALVSQPQILLLDEPTNDLDLEGETQIMRLLDNINQQLGIAIVLVTHYLPLVLNHARKIALLQPQGSLVILNPYQLSNGERMAESFNT